MALSLAFALFLGIHAGAAAALVIGLLKEIVWDGLLKRGNPDPMDVAANFVGIATAVGLYNGAQAWAI